MRRCYIETIRDTIELVDIDSGNIRSAKPDDIGVYPSDAPKNTTSIICSLPIQLKNENIKNYGQLLNPGMVKLFQLFWTKTFIFP